ncbi:MAG: hypothetical protein K6C94_01645 [Candidatus Gastranaerophilales bacterium]|nr:hypothetical protein [Candidatus Gastranaerophilales bacterium]
MGLAATQARYLGLTARKTNIEFEGQQVNQARTVLANESANLYNKLYNLQVPTPPNVTDFYKTEFSYKAGGTTYDINNYRPNSDGTYVVNVTYSDFIQVGLKAYATAAITQNPDGTYQVTISGSSKSYTVDPAAAVPDAVLDKACGKSGGYYCSYVDGDNNTTYYFDKDWLAAQTYPFNDTAQRYYKSEELTTITEDHDKCNLSFDSMGLISKIIDPTISDTELQVTAASVQDTEAYNNAMNKYTKDKDVYEKEISEINKETEHIQSEDRSLELRLRQLDTEQRTLQTELDSVKSVLDKNIEKVFKVFA